MRGMLEKLKNILESEHGHAKVKITVMLPGPKSGLSGAKWKTSKLHND